ncbi:hypothetical protein [Deinococcus rubellus]|uniref:Uncharacterized protein n=1 Tax=Deinococcus rubellus TaxID=1889240 RepID=A0ABY5YFB1_9DEIO|nr:hypothetical protein [Deinococcus rubellus]UWX63082.1 hypothetical protein N0D28_09950 [Deinococcus rubellus]
MISRRSGQPEQPRQARRCASRSEPDSLPAVWLVAALLPLIVLGGWLSQFA